MKYKTTSLPWVRSQTATEGDAVNNQGYLQGSSVTLKIDFYATDSFAPVVPTAVTLRALVHEKTTPVDITGVTFSTPAAGTYVAHLDTSNYLAGAYIWRFLAVDAGGNKFYGEDEFVLLPFTGPSGP